MLYKLTRSDVCDIQAVMMEARGMAPSEKRIFECDGSSLTIPENYKHLLMLHPDGEALIEEVVEYVPEEI